MIRLFIACAGFLLWQSATAQPADKLPDSASMQAELPEYVYCEIIAEHMPSYTGDGVLFDFGQKTSAWSYNWLRNAEGENLLFNSGIEALNYMVFRGWEFVEAYVSGKDANHTHYLLRLPSSKLTPQQRELLLTQPRSKPTRQSRQSGKQD